MGYRRWSPDQSPEAPKRIALDGAAMAAAVDRFVEDYLTWEDRRSIDYLTVTRYVEPELSGAWLERNVPMFDCPDPRVLEAYWFRWFTVLVNLKAPVDGYALSEFAHPVRHAYEHNSVNCSAPHALMETRWLRDPSIPWAYARFHLRKRGSYQVWLLDAIRGLAAVHPDPSFAGQMLQEMRAYHQYWVDHHFDQAAGLFWGSDWMDGMEFQIGGSGLRPSTNAYMFGDARAISRFALEADASGLAEQFHERAEALRRRMLTSLWDDRAGFFQTRTNEAGATWDRRQYVERFRTPHYPVRAVGDLVDVREAIGLTPWAFEMVSPGYEDAWRLVLDDAGLANPIGVNTAEARHPRFNRIRIDETGAPVENCRWDGPVWAFTTAQVLVGMDHLLRGGSTGPIRRRDYFDLFMRYTDSHFVTPGEAGSRRSAVWLGQFQDARDGRWILPHPNYYLHSTYCDPLIHGLLGIRPDDRRLVVDPLIEPDRWDYFCLDGLRIGGHDLTVLYDRTGERYGRGLGLRVWVDGRPTGETADLRRLEVSLGQTSGFGAAS